MANRPEPGRNVSFPPGETVFTEVMLRTLWPDGTSTDSPPYGPDDRVPPLATLRPSTRASVVRMERTVTVTATDWAEVAKSVPATPTPQPVYRGYGHAPMAAAGDLLAAQPDGTVGLVAGQPTGREMYVGTAAASFSAGDPIVHKNGRWVADPVLPAPRVNDYCQRVACGHARGFHSDSDEVGNLSDDEHGGMCTRCDNPEKCRSYVPKTIKKETK